MSQLKLRAMKVVTKHQRSPRKFWLAAACCGMLQHAVACFKLLVKGTIIFRKRHRFQKLDQNTVNHMP